METTCGGNAITINLNYSKEENLLPKQLLKFDWLISTIDKYEARSTNSTSFGTCDAAGDQIDQNFELVDAVNAFEKIVFSTMELRQFKWPIYVKSSKSLLILRNKNKK